MYIIKSIKIICSYLGNWDTLVVICEFVPSMFSSVTLDFVAVLSWEISDDIEFEIRERELGRDEYALFLKKNMPNGMN